MNVVEQMQNLNRVDLSEISTEIMKIENKLNDHLESDKLLNVQVCIFYYIQYLHIFIFLQYF